MARDLSLNFSRESLAPLSTKELQKRCPVAFTNEATHPTCSKNYSVICSADVVKVLEEMGWHPVLAKQVGAGATPKRSLHAIVFQKEDSLLEELRALPRIILINSLDGFTKLQFRCGLYRSVCSNGLVIADKEFDAFKLLHKNATFEDVKSLIGSTLEGLDGKIGSIRSMGTTQMTEEQAIKFMIAALVIRLGLEKAAELPKLEVSPEVLLPLHEEDTGRTDLWYHLNNAQERMGRGDLPYMKDGKGRKLQGITGLSRDLHFNTKLFELASVTMEEIGSQA